MESGWKGITDYIHLISSPPYHHGRKPTLLHFLEAGTSVMNYCSDVTNKLYSLSSPLLRVRVHQGKIPTTQLEDSYDLCTTCDFFAVARRRSSL